MDARNFIKVGMSAERTLVVPPEQTVGHFVPNMPMVFATPMMILQMELTSGDAIKRYLEPGWVTVGTEVDIRHLAATPVGATVRTAARVVAVERRVAAATARVNSGCIPSFAISTSRAAAVVPPGEVTF